MSTVCGALGPLLNSLKVPPAYARYDRIAEDPSLARLDEWKRSADRVLTEIQSILDQRTSEFSTEDQANVISAAAPFYGNDVWITPASRSAAGDILDRFSDPSTGILVQLLTQNIKPLFKLNPHPSLNATGRKLPRPAGGPMASQDFYDEQAWKSSPGVANVVSWCVRHLSSEAYEGLWHLIIPPVMTLLDDYEAPHKLQGVHIVSEMLQRVPSQLLKRTGVDGLIRTSLNTCLSHLHNPETPQLINAAVGASLRLTLLTTTVGSVDQFDQLCALLGEGIISGIWMYASDKPDVLLASLQAMPPLLRALKIGNARFLKVRAHPAPTRLKRMAKHRVKQQALITQLVHSLPPNPTNPPPAEMQLISLQLLVILAEECAACMPRWKTIIVDGVARCWVALVDAGGSRDVFAPYTADFDVLGPELRHTCESLGRCCPSVTEEEYRMLLESHPELFAELLQNKAVVL
ncbi:hypothetical protein DXG03_005312 [Asterophora parasitica]|uniref:Uncharacterized protein n=1 Tax=Asterophora parasitica TaxID=117018 RepID=A0A9P7GED0_9AGAR|nr:hypothetical protein DXG03_005312 [Asterophora parasitica]